MKQVFQVSIRLTEQQTEHLLETIMDVVELGRIKKYSDEQIKERLRVHFKELNFSGEN